MLIRVYITCLEHYSLLQGQIDQRITNLQSVEKKYTELGFSNLEIQEEGSYDDVEYNLYGKREEFPWEIEARLKAEALNEKRRLADKERREKVKAKKEQSERELFEKLKLKYEKENLS